jgi:(E)-4-hydroxy-3-methylbut-2-enyl-diphosphate synthase
VGLGTLLADGIGDTIRISLSTFHAEEEVKVAWEILKALHLRDRGPVLIACPTCGRLQFDMDTVVAEIEQRLQAYEDPIEVAVLGCAVNGIGEASHADFGITGAKNEGLIFSRGKALRKVPQDQLVDALFAEIDKYVRAKEVVVDERASAEGAAWLRAIEDEHAGDLTPERLAALEKAKADEERASGDDGPARSANGASGTTATRVRLDETVSPTTGRRFTRS